MALVFGTIVLDGPYTKIVTLTETDNAAVNERAVDYTTQTMTDFATTPIDYNVEATAATGLNITSQYHIVDGTVTTTGFSIRKTSAGAAADATIVRVTMRTIHPLDR
jgi:hypothetical protein